MANETEAQIVARQALAAQTKASDGASRPSETTYAVFMLDDADHLLWRHLGAVRVPQRTQRRSLLAKAQEQLRELDEVDAAELMFVPEEFAEPMSVKRPDAARQPLVIG